MNDLSFFIRFRRRLNAILDYDGISPGGAAGLLALIVLVTLGVRLLSLQSPAVDRTAWKEIDYIMISTNYSREGARFLNPEIDWPAESPRFTAMELPLVPYLAGLLYPVLGVNAWSVRMVTLVSFLLLTLYMYKLVRRETGPLPALIAAFLAGLLPLLNPFGQFLFSEPMMIFLSVFSIYHFAQWTDHNRWGDLAGFVAGFSLVVSLKPTALYLLLPLLWIVYRRHGFRWRPYLHMAGWLALSMVLPVLWFLRARYLAEHYLDVFGVFGGQFGGHDKFQTFTMLSDFEWYKTMFFRLYRFLFAKAGLIVLGIGVLSSLFVGRGRLFLVYLFAIGCFFGIVAEGQIDAPYRQLTIIPPAAFFLSLGVLAGGAFFYEKALDWFGAGAEPIIRRGVVFGCLALLLFMPLVRYYQFLPADPDKPVHPIHWKLAQQIKKAAREDSRIIMAGEYSIHRGGNDVSPVTYYYAGLRGWTIQEGEWREERIEELKAAGADLLGAIHAYREPELEAFLEEMAKQYEVVYEWPEEGVLLLDLKRPLSGGE